MWIAIIEVLKISWNCCQWLSLLLKITHRIGGNVFLTQTQKPSRGASKKLFQKTGGCPKRDTNNFTNHKITGRTVCVHSK